ncbi:hypothetical protein [Ectopseudomonas khazarica]|uniref:hypothetical protein n=1 Tax=Ectopseudomonas khazarica TaxID=2502979 RepID=UPI002FE18B11
MKRLVMFIALFVVADIACAEIIWRVDNSFRLIDYVGSGSKFKMTEGQTAFGFVTEKLAERDKHVLPPIASTELIRDSGSRRRFSSDYLFPQSQAVSARLSLPEDGDCTWEYQGEVKSVKCADEFRFNARTQFGSGDGVLTVRKKHDGMVESTVVVVWDRLILGLGDSYASGEGNPDIPTVVDKEGLDVLVRNSAQMFATGRWMNSTEFWVAKNAEWLDKQCHRSMLSQHVLAGLRISTYNKHETITMMPLACSGAEVLDGILIPQKSPPGGGDQVLDSQLNVAVEHLCKGGVTSKVKKVYYRGYTGRKNRKAEKAILKKCKGELRVPDAILLSVGGNDVGFAPSIAWATLPADGRHFLGRRVVNITNKAIKPVCPKYTGRNVCIENAPVGKDRIKYWLPDYYDYLSEGLRESGLADGSNAVYLTAYPNPIYTEDGRTVCDKDRSADVVEQARSRIPGAFRPAAWELQIRKEELVVIDEGLIKPLYNQMRVSADKHGWVFVDGYIEDIRPHGICAGFFRRDSYVDGSGVERYVPLYPHVINGKWYPREPSTDWAYDTSRTRWFRNTNDSVLYQNDNTGSVMNGAFHPDFRVHALIADYLYGEVIGRWRDKPIRQSALR